MSLAIVERPPEELQDNRRKDELRVLIREHQVFGLREYIQLTVGNGPMHLNIFSIIGSGC